MIAHIVLSYYGRQGSLYCPPINARKDLSVFNEFDALETAPISVSKECVI